MFKQTWCLTNS